LLDVHAIKDSQNGFDNSGQAANVEWVDETHFKHWSMEAGNWMGHWNGSGYDSIN
jgi:glucan 1,3-beta-glucosidase